MAMLCPAAKHTNAPLHHIHFYGYITAHTPIIPSLVTIGSVAHMVTVVKYLHSSAALTAFRAVWNLFQ